MQNSTRERWRPGEIRFDLIPRANEGGKRKKKRKAKTLSTCAIAQSPKGTQAARVAARETAEGSHKVANRDLGKVENRKPGRAEGRATGGWPEGRGIRGDASHRLPNGSSEGGAGGKPANQMSGSERVNIRRMCGTGRATGAKRSTS